MEPKVVFQVQVSTMGGQLFEIRAKDAWTVRDLKGAVEKSSGMPYAKMTLIDTCGEELCNETALSSLSLGGDAILQVTVYSMPKSKEDAEWLKKWEETTPGWLKEGTEVAFTGEDFKRLKQECPLHGKGVRCSCNLFGGGGCVGRVNWGLEESCAGEEEDVMTPKQLLAFLERGGRYMRFNENTDYICFTEEVHIVGHATSTTNSHHKATLEMVTAAAQQAPHIVMPYVDFTIAYELVQKCSGVYKYLPESLPGKHLLLHEALEVDLTLRADFLSTASKSEVHKWQWERDERK